ncbi:MAG: hypothetical protein HZA90_07120 [Verrucomicrobia bacterium]|nr:hypothetical protein [Verrucomicrobiota bacterium]
MNNPVFRLQTVSGFYHRHCARTAWMPLCLAALAAVATAGAQVTNLFEGFEGTFPGAWSVGDANASGTPAYWGRVDSAFGGEGTHAGSYKGYCAGVGYAGTTSAPVYVTNMTATMSRSVNLAVCTNAQLSFWYKVPSIEATYDWIWVFMDSTPIWSNNAVRSSWTLTNFSLNAFVGTTRTLKFQFVSDVSVNQEGWYLDDLTLTVIYPPVANDNFATATAFASLSGTTSGTTLGATKEIVEPNHHGNTGGSSVWFRWTAPLSGTVTFNTFGSGFDTLLAVYTGASVGALTTVTSNDDTPVGNTSSVTFDATAGTVYRIAVDGYNGAAGSYTLSWLYPTVNETAVTTAITNLSNFVIDSDASSGDPSYNRETFLLESDVVSTNTAAISHYTTYVLSYRLLDTNGQAHPLFDSTGVTNAAYTCNVTNTVWIGSSQNLTSTTPASLRPAALLSSLTQYTAEVRLFRRGIFTGDTDSDGPTIYLHFTNTVSGDVAYNVIPYHFGDAFAQTFAIKTAPGKTAFLVNAVYGLYRYDEFNSASPVTNDVTVYINYELRSTNGTLVPLVNNSTSFVHAVPSFTAGAPKGVAAVGASDTLQVEPVGQLDSVSNSYYVVVNLSCYNGPGQPVVAASTMQTSPTRLLHFNGHLRFNNIDTVFTSINNTPAAGATGVGYLSTTLGVDANSGYVVADPAHTYGSGVALDVRLRSSGNAELNSGSVTLNAPSPDLDAVGRVRFVRGPITLDPTGGYCNLTVFLPPGFSYRLNNTASKLTRGSIDFPGLQLNGSLNPLSATLVFNPGVPIYAVEETKPVWMEIPAITWVVANGVFNTTVMPVPTYVRAADYAYLEGVSNQLVNPPSMALKRSNERYWNSVTGMSQTLQVAADSQSNAVLTSTFDFGPGNFVAHIPYDTAMEWTGAGTMVVSTDLPVPNVSKLDGFSAVQVPYTGDCPGCNPAGITNTPAIAPNGTVLNFTLDGGLVGEGPAAPTVNLRWGYITDLGTFAQQAFTFTEGAYHMPGVFLRGLLNSLPPNSGPANILYTGVAASNLLVLERPLSAAYSDGFADYAGLNFRCLTDNAHNARSTIGGRPNVNWKLTGRSKYYVRYAGVTGIHEAVPGTFPSTLYIYGYKFTFDNYGLSYLDSQNLESRTYGSITVPYPSDFVQRFDELKFDCLGALLDAKVPSNDGFKMLNYWQADFKTLAIRFLRNDGCAPGDGSLTLGVEAYASHVDEPLYGLLGFQTNGNLIAKSYGLKDGTKDFDSRLKVPNSFSIDGPSGSAYTFMPIIDTYYNSYSNAPPSPGWINLIGKLDVPFFEDMKTHLQTSCRTNIPNVNPAIYLSGGWARTGSGNPNHGWQDGGQDFFTASYFDPDNFGFPQATVSLDNYRNNTAEDYHPRAQKLWLEVVDFDYPLSWSTTTRTFKSWQERTNDLLVINVRHQVTYLDPLKAELDFGVQYDGLPKISITSIAINAIDETTGVAHSIIEAATQPIHDVLKTGVDQMDQMLDAQMHRFFDGVFDATVDPIISQFYRQLSNDWAALSVSQRALFVSNVAVRASNSFIGTVSMGTSNLSFVLQNLGNATSGAGNLIDQTRTYLGNVTNAIDAVTGGIDKTTNGAPLGGFVKGLLHKAGDSYDVAPALVENLVIDFAADFIESVTQPELDNQLKKVQPALEQVETVLGQTKDAIVQVDSQLATGGQFVTEIDNTLHGLTADITNVSVTVTKEITNFFGKLDFTVDDPFQVYTEQQIKDYVRQQVEDAFFASVPAVQIQTAVRQRLYDLDAQMTEAIDSGFQQLNTAMRDMISESLADLDNSINGLLGDVSDTMGAGKIDGHAVITGDALTLLRLDGHFEWKAPDAMQFDAYLQIKELNSDGSSGCYSSNTPATEVTLGAKDVSLDWISPDLTCSIETKFTFDNSIPFPVNLAGTLELNGELSFEAFKLYNLAASVAFGKYENYLALRGGVKFNSYDFSGAIFFGRTCTLDPIKLIDPDVASVLGNPPFTGAYVYAQGWIPVSEAVLGIPASCLFRISAGVGAGAFYFVEGPTYGGKMFLGVSGEALCIVSIEGDITMIGVKHGDDLQFKGTGHFEAEIGPCPFCLSFSKSISLQYKNSSWHID